MEIKQNLEIKKIILEKFITHHNKLAPQQRTQEWYNIRKSTIGGSEISTVLGLNPFKSKKQLILDKIGISSFSGNINTRWGVLFENITKNWAQNVLLMEEEILETGSIEGCINRQRYSPDGLGIVKLKYSDDTYDYFIVLFEFKAPLKSFPNGAIPKYYLPQINTGLLNISIADTAIFINNSYRKCPLSKFGFNPDYDEKFHAADFKKKKYGLTKNKVLACGIICFYQSQSDLDRLIKHLGYDEANDDGMRKEEQDEALNDELDYKYGDVELLVDSVSKPTDFGKSSYFDFNRLLELIEMKRVIPHYCSVIHNYKESNKLEFIDTHSLQSKKIIKNPNCIAKDQIEKFQNVCRNDNNVMVGYLPWKLLKSDIILGDRDDNWRNIIESPIKETLDIIDRINISENPLDEFNRLFNATDNATDNETDNDLNDEICNEFSSIFSLESDKLYKRI